MMDFNREIESELTPKRSFNLNVKLYDLLHIATNSNNNIILWNKYQIFLYETSDFSAKPLQFQPLFKIQNIVFNDKYIACLDSNKNIHITYFKFIKSLGQKLRIAFEPVAQDIITLLELENDQLLTLENKLEKFSVCIHSFSSDFQKNVDKYTLVNFKESFNENIIFKSRTILNLNIQCLEMVFKINKKDVFDGILAVVVLDSRTLYGFILNKSKDNIDKNISVKKLYYASTDICEVNIIELGYDLKIITVLKFGTIIILPFGNNLVPQVIHLNTQINKFIAIKDEFIYSDGITMWKTINSYTKHISFQELFVKNTRDFVVLKDLAICVTYSNIVYVFSIEYNAKIKEENEYQPVNSVAQSIELLFQEIKKNDELAKRIEIERNYTIAIALGNRQDIINDIIQYSVTAFESYDEVLNENPNITLTSHSYEYFIPNTFLILIKLIFKSDYNSDLKKIFLSLTDLLKLHITIRTKTLILKTISFSIRDLDECSFLIPLNCGKGTEFNINSQLICPIGYLYDKEPNWVILLRRNVNLMSESFIKATKTDETTKITQLRNNTDDFTELLIKTAKNLHGYLDFQKECKIINQISYYIKLPTDYEEIFSNKNTYRNINNSQADFLFKKLSTNDFLKRNHVVQINIHEFKIRLEIFKDDEYILKLQGDNALIVFHIKNYFNQILFKDNVKQIISQAEYTKIEDLRRKLITLQCSRDLSCDSIMQIADQFNKNILSNIIYANK